MKLTKHQANQILSKNVLDLSAAGLEYMPMKTICIESFLVMNYHPENNRKNDKGEMYHEAELLGLVKDNTCSSYFISVHHQYYYREYFQDAIDVIEALRVVNDYIKD